MMKHIHKPIEDKRVSITDVKPETDTNNAKRKIGYFLDVFVSIDADFDETPDCMKEYA